MLVTVFDNAINICSGGFVDTESSLSRSVPYVSYLERLLAKKDKLILIPLCHQAVTAFLRGKIGRHTQYYLLNLYGVQKLLQ